MDLQLQGKRALVTGSTAGIGLAIAIGLAKEGVHVILNGRTAARVDKAVAEVKRVVPGADAVGIAADVATASGCASVVAGHPSVDILVNNMGIFEPKPFEEIPDEDWLRFFETNVLSGVRLSRHYLPIMKAEGWGRILFISSESAVQIPSEMVHYGMTKTAQVAVARGIAETTSGTGVTVNSVLVGPTKSEGVETFVARMASQRGVDEATMEGDFFKTARPTSLLKRFITVEEIANTVVYLASPAASATNGAAVRADGGVLKGIL